MEKTNSLLLGLVFALLLVSSAVRAEDGYELWLRYRQVSQARAADITRQIQSIACPELQTDPAIAKAAAEVQRAVHGMTNRTPTVAREIAAAGTLVLASKNAPLLKTLGIDAAKLDREEYSIKTVQSVRGKSIVVSGGSGVGVLYGTFALLQSIASGQSLDALDARSVPQVKLRLLNHWDNLNGTVERGYAGASLWDWWKLPDFNDPRYEDYARANASIGINGTVLNNVNARAESLSSAYIAKASALAQVFRPYGIKVYLSVRWTAPMELGGLTTADPLDKNVRQWWIEKADEIYRTIPDFGGFLVKANSEGQPGPQDYGRNHADGANMLAAAVAPHGGVVMWRAFVYSDKQSEDRAKQAYNEFKPLDGKFADNVLVQVKNGAIDFQPREPFHPLFGAMPQTALMMEFQLTKEYLGFATHLAYLGPMFEEALQSDTFTRGKDSTVAHVVMGSLSSGKLTGMAGVANIGQDRDWSGSTFNQANWFVFGRLAWNPQRPARDIAREWSQLTFGTQPAVTAAVVDMMMRSREAVVNYMTPLGLAHLMGTGHHYGPAPWVNDLLRPEWNPTYYHQADVAGIGFARGPNGSNAVSQYAQPLAADWSKPETTSDELLLWFHRLPWNYRMRSGRSLWEELIARYDLGVREVGSMRTKWESLRGKIDAERFEKTSRYLEIQEREAKWWRDACIAYFASRSQLPLPSGVAPPERSLDYYQSLQFKYTPGSN